MRPSRPVLRRPSRQFAVVLLSSVALLTACGDDGNTTAADPSSTTTSSTTSTTTAGGAVTLAQTCETDRYSVGFPAGWATNPGTVVPRCRYFHPEPFTVPEATEVVDRAVILDVESMPYDRMVEATGGETEEVLARRELTVSQRRALRVEVRSTDGLLPVGTESLRYMVDLGNATLIAVTHGVEGSDHQRNRTVLEAMVDSLVIPVGEDCSAANYPADPTAGNVPYTIAGMPVANALSFYYGSAYSLTDAATGAKHTCADMADAGACAPPAPAKVKKPKKEK